MYLLYFPTVIGLLEQLKGSLASCMIFLMVFYLYLLLGGLPYLSILEEAEKRAEFANQALEPFPPTPVKVSERTLFPPLANFGEI